MELLELKLGYTRLPLSRTKHIYCNPWIHSTSYLEARKKYVSFIKAEGCFQFLNHWCLSGETPCSRCYHYLFQFLLPPHSDALTYWKTNQPSLVWHCDVRADNSVVEVGLGLQFLSHLRLIASCSYLLNFYSRKSSCTSCHALFFACHDNDY